MYGVPLKESRESADVRGLLELNNVMCHNVRKSSHTLLCTYVSHNWKCLYEPKRRELNTDVLYVNHMKLYLCTYTHSYVLVYSNV